MPKFSRAALKLEIRSIFLYKSQLKLIKKPRRRRENFWGFWDTVFVFPPPPLRIPWSDNKGG